MNIICSQFKLNETLNIVTKAVSSKSSLPVLEGIYLEAENGKLKLVSNDLEIGIETYIDADVLTPGKVVLNAKMLSGIIKNLPDERVSISVNDNLMTTIKAGNAKFEILGISHKDFPALPEIDATYSISLNQGVFKNMINKTSFAVSHREDKPVLRGCLLEINPGRIRMVALDGYRLAMREEKIEGDFDPLSIIIPEKALNELTKILKDDEEVLINITGKQAYFICDNFKLVTRLIEGEYIKYESVIPKSFEIDITCPIMEMVHCVYRASLIITNDLNKSPIKMNFFDDTINISCETNAGKVDDIILTNTKGANLEIGFDNNYLMDALRACDGDIIRMGLNKSISPLVITPEEGDNFLQLILPVKIRW